MTCIRGGQVLTKIGIVMFIAVCPWMLLHVASDNFVMPVTPHPPSGKRKYLRRGIGSHELNISRELVGYYGIYCHQKNVVS